MNLHHLSVLLFLALFSAFGLQFQGSARADTSQTPLVVPVPDWVISNPIPEFTLSGLKSHENGEAWLLSDNQVRFIENGNASFNRFVTKVIDRIGLESSSNLSITIDPSRQKIGIVQAGIIRSGVKIDQTNNLRTEFFRSESDVSNGILRGSVKYSVLIPDVRVNDVVDVSYVIETRESLLGLPFGTQIWLALGTPIERLYRRIVWPNSKPLNIKTFNSPLAATVTDLATDKEYVWDLRKPAPYKGEPDQAPGKLYEPSVYISEASSWQEIVDLMLPYYKADAKLPENLMNRIREISEAHSDSSERLTEALRIVQDEIRYVSLSIGPGALIPRPPAEVYLSGYGDCKDKALLLVTILKQLGITAQVALANLSSGREIIHQPPSIAAFDHAIVRVEMKAFTLWLDATDFSQGGRGYSLVQPDYGFALALKQGVKELERMPERFALAPTQTTTETYELPKSASGKLLIDVETVYRHDSADRLRKNIAADGADSYDERYFQYYLKKIPNLIHEDKISINDDRNKNEIVIWEKYSLPEFDIKTLEFAKDFPITAIVGLADLPEIPKEPRKTPLYIGKPFNFKHVVVIKNAKSSYGVIENTEKGKPWFDFTAIDFSNENSSTLTWGLKSNGGEVQPADLEKFKAAVTAVEDSTARLYNFAYEDEPPLEQTLFGNPRGIVSVLLMVILVSGIILNWRVPEQKYLASAFQPVGLGKFFAMGFLTGTLYYYVWAWNGYKRYKLQSKSFSFPLGMAIIHTLLVFNIMNISLKNVLTGTIAKMSILTLAGVTSYFVSGATDFYITAFTDWTEHLENYKHALYNFTIVLVPSVALLPLMGQLIQLNIDQVATDKSYKQFSKWDFAAIAFIFPVFAYSLYLDFIGA